MANVAIATCPSQHSLLCEAVLDVLWQLGRPRVGVHEGRVRLHQQPVQRDHVVLKNLPHAVLGLVLPQVPYSWSSLLGTFKLKC